MSPKLIPQFQCNVCGKRFETDRGRLQHLRRSKCCDLPTHLKIASNETINPATTARDDRDVRDATSVRHPTVAVEPELNTAPAARSIVVLNPTSQVVSHISAQGNSPQQRTSDEVADLITMARDAVDVRQRTDTVDSERTLAGAAAPSYANNQVTSRLITQGKLKWLGAPRTHNLGVTPTRAALAPIQRQTSSITPVAQQGCRVRFAVSTNDPIATHNPAISAPANGSSASDSSRVIFNFPHQTPPQAILPLPEALPDSPPLDQINDRWINTFSLYR